MSAPTTPVAPPATPYDDAFYASQADGSLRSARAVAPLVMGLVAPASVLDVGCGLGTWLAAFAELGVTDILGIDGDYVDRTKLKIPADRFRPVNLNAPPPLGRAFDLAVCLEVAEHLPEAAAPGLVQLLTGSAPAVLFSAAVPGQQGTDHINEQWPAFWRELFKARGFVRLDPIRPRVLRDRRVESWYQQNTFLFVRETELAARPAWREEHRLATEFPFQIVREEAFAELTRPDTLRGVLGRLPGAAWGAVRRRLPGGGRR
ncbi:MAG: class I SAM-dependent methyltransferase [Gemmata sp.]